MLGSNALTSTRGAIDKKCIWSHASNGSPQILGLSGRVILVHSLSYRYIYNREDENQSYCNVRSKLINVTAWREYIKTPPAHSATYIPA